jgi:hypothetical protein
MIRKAALVLCAAAGLLCASSPASAWTKFHNASPNPIWAAHKFDSVSGFLCGYSDGCSGPESRVTGWWWVAAGGTITVDSRGWGNARHEVWAEDGLGSVWEGGDGTCLPNTAGFDTCQYNDWLCAQPDSTYFYFAYVRNTTCCGGSCPSNGTVHFNP